MKFWDGQDDEILFDYLDILLDLADRGIPVADYLEELNEW